MSNRIQDLEQMILRDQNIIQDLDDLFEGVCEYELNTDQVSNVLMGLIQLYKIRHEKTWDTFTEVVREYYKFRKEAGYNHDSIVDIESDGPDLWSKDFTNWRPGNPEYDAAMAELEKEYKEHTPDPYVADVGEKPTEEEKAVWPAKQTRKRKK